MKISKIHQFLESYKKLAPETSPKRSDKKKVRRVEEDEMNVSMLSPSAPMDTLECSDSFATGDFRFPSVLGKIQRRRKKKAEK